MDHYGSYVHGYTASTLRLQSTVQLSRFVRLNCSLTSLHVAMATSRCKVAIIQCACNSDFSKGRNVSQGRIQDFRKGVLLYAGLLPKAVHRGA